MDRYRVIDTFVSRVNKQTSVKELIDNFDRAKNSYICCANAHTVVTAYENSDYRNILNNSFLTLPDGKPIANVAKCKGYKEVDKVSGVDFMEMVLEQSCKKGYNNYFYGNTKDNLNAFILAIKEKFPQLKIAGYEPSIFRPLNIDEEKELKERILKANTDIVWVALGAPRQELFSAKMCKETNAVWVAVGGAFNVLANITPRAPKWMQDHSLEWFYRFIKEPKRLFKRYAVTNTKYIIYRLLNK